MLNPIYRFFKGKLKLYKNRLIKITVQSAEDFYNTYVTFKSKVNGSILEATHNAETE
jgi:hypothetical protein